MLNKQRIWIVHLWFAAVIFVGCASQEYMSAKLYIKEQEWEKAKEFLVKAIEVEPENPEIPYQLGYHIYALQEKDWEKMNQSFDKALAIDPNKILKLGQEKTVKEFVTMARYQFWVEMFNKGVAEFEEYQVASSDSASNAALKKAITTFEISATIKTDELRSYIQLSRCNNLAGNTDKSVDYILKAVALSPDDANVNLTAGRIFMQKQEFETALPYIQKAVELEPSNTQSIRNLAQIYYDLALLDSSRYTERLEKSIQTYEVAIDKEMDREVKADLYFNLGILYTKADNLEEAEYNFMNALDENPDDIEAVMGMAQIFENAEKWRKAEKFYRELIAVDPDNPDHYRGMSRVLLQQGEPDESLRYLEKAKRLGG
jgi:tetratricopeptide (TPR) repeat protein